MKNKNLWVLVASLVTVTVFAKTVYVDVNRPDDTGDGLSWAAAKHTIQAAVNTAATGDTVLVKPGVYNEGSGHPDSSPECNYLSRVYINHGITLKSTDGAAVTHIVGARDPDTLNTAGMLGNGPKAVRCIFVNHGTSMTTIVEGFTIRDGAAHQETATDSDNGLSNGGGLRVNRDDTPAYLVDCIVENCTGRRGGAMRYGTAVRTLFRKNYATGKGGVGAYGKYLFCVMSGNETPPGGVCVGGTYVNCTVVNNFNCTVTFTESAKVHNTIAVQNDGMMCNDSSMTFGHSLVDNTRNVVTYDDATILEASVYQFFAPLMGDYRLLPNAQALEVASSENLAKIALPASIEVDKDVFGTAFDRTQPFHAGAVQSLSPEPVGGAMYFTSGKISIDGVPAVGHANYMYTETYPTQVLVRLTNTTDRVFTWRYKDNAGQSRLRGPLPDDSVWIMPPVVGRVQTNELLTAHDVYYVDANAAAGGDGSATNPFNTIQKAVDVVPGNGARRALIHVAEGVYDSDEGLTVASGMTNRVSFTGGKYVRLLGAGEGKTIVMGKDDPNGPAGDGRGPAAIRCIGADNGLVCVQNMTLTGGRVDYIGDNNGGTDIPATCGGAVRVANNNDFYFSDCTISNSLGFRGAIYRGTFARCRITDSAGYGGGMRYARMLCCVVDNMRTLAGASSVAHGNWLNQCTIVGRSTDEELQTDDLYTNVVIHTTRWINPKMILRGGVVWNFQGAKPAACEAKLANPLFTRGDGDYMPLATSPVIGAGYFYDDYPDDYSPDRNGNPICFVDGKPCSGAFQTFRSGYSVELNTPSYGITTQPAGYAELAPGESVTISVDLSGAQRPCTAIAVDGVATNVTSVTFTAPAAGEPTQGIRVTPLVSPDWYVDPAGSDAANGFTPETAKKTFKGVFDTGYVLAGDTIHAAEGRYEEGEMPNTGYSASVVNARVAVPEKVAVVGAGRNKSFIVGAPAPADTADENGNGAGSVRGVYIRNGGVVKGFTITGGHTCTTGEWNENNYGGGVLSAGSESLIADCDIVDNASSRGGGAHQGRFVNCRFFRNRAYTNRAGASNAFLYNCVFDENYGENAIQNCYDTINCTFGVNNKRLDGTTATLALALPLGPVVNCLVLGNYNATAEAQMWATNCIFAGSLWTQSYYHFDETTKAYPLAELVVDENFVPVIGQNKAIDAGTTVGFALYPEGASQTTDALGGQRIYNGTIDIGALEADWRGEYAKAIGSKNVTVTNATPGVVLVEKTVQIPNGESIAGTWGRDLPKATIDYAGQATAVDGTLTGAIGAQAVVAENATEPIAIRSPGQVYAFDFSFAGEGYGSLSGFSTRHFGGTYLIFR